MTNYGPSASGPSLPQWMGPDDPDYPDKAITAGEKIGRVRANLDYLLDAKIFERIGAITRADPLVAFIYMSCAIDCLAGFRRGQPKTTHKDYEDFVRDFFPEPTGQQSAYDPHALYEDLRCALVHNLALGQTYFLTHDHPDRHRLRTRRGQIILNADSFHADLAHAKDKYLAEVNEHPKLAEAAYARLEYKIIGIVPYELAYE